MTSTFATRICSLMNIALTGLAILGGLLALLVLACIVPSTSHGAQQLLIHLVTWQWS